MNDFPEKILVATDGSRDAATAMRRAAALARDLGSELHVVHVIPVSDTYHLSGVEDADGPSLYEEDSDRARKLLERQVREVEGSGVEVRAFYIRAGEPDAEVVALGEEIGASMIVVGSRGLSPLRRPIGSVSSSIASHAHCPVLVVRDERP